MEDVGHLIRPVLSLIQIYLASTTSTRMEDSSATSCDPLVDVAVHCWILENKKTEWKLLLLILPTLAGTMGP